VRLWQTCATRTPRNHTAPAARERRWLVPVSGSGEWREPLATPDLPAYDATVFVLQKAPHCRRPVQLPGGHAGVWPARLRPAGAIRARSVGVRWLCLPVSCVELVCFVRFRPICLPFCDKNICSHFTKRWGICQVFRWLSNNPGPAFPSPKEQRSFPWLKHRAFALGSL
jgi:hypothetical protein